MKVYSKASLSGLLLTLRSGDVAAQLARKQLCTFIVVIWGKQKEDSSLWQTVVGFLTGWTSAAAGWFGLAFTICYLGCFVRQQAQIMFKLLPAFICIAFFKFYIHHSVIYIASETSFAAFCFSPFVFFVFILFLVKFYFFDWSFVLLCKIFGFGNICAFFRFLSTVTLNLKGLLWYEET